MEAHSLEESISILNKYKDQLTEKEYANVRSVIGNYAIENMFLNEDEILKLNINGTLYKKDTIC